MLLHPLVSEGVAVEAAVWTSSCLCEAAAVGMFFSADSRRMTSMPGILSSMPPLPVKLNTPLADSFLPPSKTLPLPPPVTTPPK